MEQFKLQLLIDRAREIRDKAAGFNLNEDFAKLQHLLTIACDSFDREELRRPLIIAIAGGTGVGKSYIFSSLCGIENLSPSSASIRGFTRKLHISASEEDRGFLPFSEDEAKFVDICLPGFVLIDTPDLDTIHSENARIARKTVSVADIIVCVTTPDKRSDFIVNQSVIEWAARKRWFFAMNKADTADVDAQLLRHDFTARLQALGFDNCNNAAFVFSASKRDDEFKSFRESILSARSLQSNRLLKQEACLRQMIHAFDHERLSERLLKILIQLKNSRDTLKERLLAAEKKIVTSAEISLAAQQAFLSWAYQVISKQRSFFLFPYLLLNRWLIDEKETGILEKEIARSYHNSIELKNHFTDERRSLEDKLLILPGDPKESAANEYLDATGNEIIHQIRQSAEQTANSKLLKFYIFLANLLPLVILLQVLYRSISSWTSAVWLPTEFFLHALFLILAATIPGYLLLSRGLNRISQQIMPEAPRREIKLQLLEKRIDQIEDLLQKSSQLYAAAETELKKVRTALPEKSYGISAGNQQL